MEPFLHRFILEECTDTRTLEKAFWQGGGGIHPSGARQHENVHLRDEGERRYSCTLRDIRYQNPKGLCDADPNALYHPRWDYSAKYTPGDDILLQLLRKELVSRGFDKNYSKAAAKLRKEDSVFIARVREEQELIKRRKRAELEYHQAVLNSHNTLWNHFKDARDVLLNEETAEWKKLCKWHLSFIFSTISAEEQLHRRTIIRDLLLARNEIEAFEQSERDDVLDVMRLKEKANLENRLREAEEARRYAQQQALQRAAEEFQRRHLSLTSLESRMRQSWEEEETVARQNLHGFFMRIWTRFMEGARAQAFAVAHHELEEKEKQKRRIIEEEFLEVMAATSAQLAKCGVKIEEMLAARKAQVKQMIITSQRDEAQKRNEVEQAEGTARGLLKVEMTKGYVALEAFRRATSEVQEQEAERRKKLLQTEQGEQEALIALFKQAQRAHQQKKADLAALRTKAELSNKPFLGLSLAEKSNGSLVVDSLYRGGPAYVAGVQLGDQIVSVEGLDVQSLEDVRRAMKSSVKMGTVARIVVYRSDQNNSVESADETPKESNLHPCEVLVMTSDPQYAELSDIYFDITTHEKLLREKKKVTLE